MDKKKIDIIIGIMVVILALVAISVVWATNDCTNYAGEIVDSKIDYKSNDYYKGHVKIDFSTSYPNSASINEDTVKKLKKDLKDENDTISGSMKILDDELLFEVYDISDVSLKNNILTIKFDGECDFPLKNHGTFEVDEIHLNNYFLEDVEELDNPDYMASHGFYDIWGFNKGYSSDDVSSEFKSWFI